MTTHARVVCIALPIVLSNATSPLLGAVDTAVIGQLGLAAPTGAVVPGRRLHSAKPCHGAGQRDEALEGRDGLFTAQGDAAEAFD